MNNIDNTTNNYMKKLHIHHFVTTSGIIFNFTHCQWLSIFYIQENDLTRGFASTVKRSAAVHVQASPIPAIHVQCAHTTSPEKCVAIHTFIGGMDKL